MYDAIKDQTDQQGVWQMHLNRVAEKWSSQNMTVINNLHLAISKTLGPKRGFMCPLRVHGIPDFSFYCKTEINI
jgi:hypothetical protein